MKLSAYLDREGIKGAEFARRTGLSEATISLLCRGEIWVSRKSAKKIADASNGEVTANDFMEAAE
jgi:transcriptional regulator with XRE-family HTH domain